MDVSSASFILPHSAKSGQQSPALVEGLQESGSVGRGHSREGSPIGDADEVPGQEVQIRAQEASLRMGTWESRAHYWRPTWRKGSRGPGGRGRALLPPSPPPPGSLPRRPQGRDQQWFPGRRGEAGPLNPGAGQWLSFSNRRAGAGRGPGGVSQSIARRSSRVEGRGAPEHVGARRVRGFPFQASCYSSPETFETFEAQEFLNFQENAS